MYQSGAKQLKELSPRNPDSIPSRLEQAITGLNGSVALASSIREKLFGSVPEGVPDKSMNTVMEPNHVTYQLDILQARITELEAILGQINQNV